MQSYQFAYYYRRSTIVPASAVTSLSTTSLIVPSDMPPSEESQIAMDLCAALCQDIDKCMQQHCGILSEMESLADVDDIGLAFELWLDDLSTDQTNMDALVWPSILETFRDCEHILHNRLGDALGTDLDAAGGHELASQR
jgi:hypothetical protein